MVAVLLRCGVSKAAHEATLAFYQAALAFPHTWGGKRAGAGRKRAPGRGSVPHLSRPSHHARHPVHITLRSTFRPLRSQYVFPTVRHAIAAVQHRHRFKFRVAHFAVLFDHVHLIVEAEDREALLAGVRGLAISIARRVNRLTFRKGAFWDGRWHGRALTTPRAVRHAIVYVLGNAKKHGCHDNGPIDAYSSAPYFAGFTELAGSTAIELGWLCPNERWSGAPPVAQPRSWLLAGGWRRSGPISVSDAPRG